MFESTTCLQLLVEMKTSLPLEWLRELVQAVKDEEGVKAKLAEAPEGWKAEVSMDAAERPLLFVFPPAELVKFLTGNWSPISLPRIGVPEGAVVIRFLEEEI